MMMKNQLFSPRTLGRAAFVVLVAAGIGLTGCDDLLDVNNPNSLLENDLENPAASPSLVSGSRFTVGQAYSYVLSQYSVATDEQDWIGSRDAWGQIERGFLTNTANEFTDQAFPFVGEARWTADNAVLLLEDFHSRGILADQEQLAQAYLYGALAYMLVADAYDDFAFSDRNVPAGRIGEDNMGQLYDMAIDYLAKGMELASPGLRTNLLAVRARAKHARAVWNLLNPKGAIPSGPWVDAGADDAAAYLDLVGLESDAVYQFTFTATTVQNYTGLQTNNRQEHAIADTYKTLNDPVTGELDPRVQLAIRNYDPNVVIDDDLIPLPYTSSREMHLILAESALAQGNEAEAVTHINNVRALGGMAEYDPDTSGVSVGDMLKHERQANLFMQIRRLADMYRYGMQAPRWDATSEASTTPGTFFPITDVEITANPLID